MDNRQLLPLDGDVVKGFSYYFVGGGAKKGVRKAKQTHKLDNTQRGW